MQINIFNSRYIDPKNHNNAAPKTTVVVGKYNNACNH